MPRETKRPSVLDRGVILCWNRNGIELESVATYDEEFAVCAHGGTVEGTWSVGRYKNIEVGTRAFMLTQGNEHPRGIIGHGIITAEPFEDEAFNDPTKTMNYVEVLWDALLPFNEPIPISTLVEEVPAIHWAKGIRASGHPVKSDALEDLLRLWNSYDPLQEEPGPGEFEPGEYWEGAVRTVTVNRYERDPRARQACLDHHGYTCQACEQDLTETYGEDLGRRAIHVHHIIPMATRGEEYKLNPLADLVPLCPNCHNVIHKTDPVMTPVEFRKKVLRH